MKTSILIAALFFMGSTWSYAQETPTKKDSVKAQEISSINLTKKVFQKKADRFVYDVAASPIAKGNTTFDLLKQTPLVSTNDEKSLQIVGKSNAIVYINGRKTNMDATSLIQLLKNTPAENIQKIEVITVPGSEYQVEASDGIINIILKKKLTDGTSGTVRMANTQNKYNNSSSSFNLNYRKNKLGINASLSGSDGYDPQDYIIRNGNATAFSESVGQVNDREQNLGGYVTFDYQLNDKSNIALTWNSWNNISPESTVDLLNTITALSPTTNQWSKHYTLSQNEDRSRSYNNSWNLNYELKTDSLGSKLNVNAAYLNYKRYQYSVNNTLLSNENREPLALLQQIVQNVPQKIDNFSGTVDYLKKYKNDFTVGIGGNFNKTKTDNDTQYQTIDYSAATTIAKPNHFIYDETIYGLYLTLEKKFSEKLSGKIGSRYEMTNTLGTSDNAPTPEMQRIEKKYNRFLPYLSASYQINDKNSVSYSFSSRVRRPSFWELNPVKNLLTDDNYTQNNPFVQASSSYNQELTYMFKNTYFLVLNHTFFTDVITQVPLQKEIVKNGVTYNKLAYIRTNFGDKQQMSATIGMQKSFFKQYWTTNMVVGLQHNRNNGSLNFDPTTGEQFDTYINKNNSTSLLLKTSNTIRLDKAKTWFATVDAMYMDAQQIELGTLAALSTVDIGLKKIWNEWTFAVNATDIFRGYIIKIKDEQKENGNFNYVQNDTYRRGATLSITYNFGNKQVKKTRNIESAADDIKNRTR